MYHCCKYRLFSVQSHHGRRRAWDSAPVQVPHDAEPLRDSGCAGGPHGLTSFVNTGLSRVGRWERFGVLDSAGKLVGVVSQSGISDKVAAENRSAAISVYEIMTRELVTVAPETSLDDCVRQMEKHGILHLLVVDAQGEFRGMISVTDLLQVIASDQKARADMLESLWARWWRTGVRSA